MHVRARQHVNDYVKRALSGGAAESGRGATIEHTGTDDVRCKGVEVRQPAGDDDTCLEFGRA